jgi:hypothetical protein
MAEHHFELTIRGTLTSARLDALYEAGCDDATFSSNGELTFGELDREAPTLPVAILSAIAEVARQSVDMLIKGQRGPGNFPAPASHATRNPLWRWSEVEAWFARYKGRPADTERSAAIGAINGALDARHGLRASAHKGPLRQALRQLLAS